MASMSSKACMGKGIEDTVTTKYVVAYFCAPIEVRNNYDP